MFKSYKNTNFRLARLPGNEECSPSAHQEALHQHQSLVRESQRSHLHWQTAPASGQVACPG